MSLAQVEISGGADLARTTNLLKLKVIACIKAGRTDFWQFLSI